MTTIPLSYKSQNRKNYITTPMEIVDNVSFRASWGTWNYSWSGRRFSFKVNTNEKIENTENSTRTFSGYAILNNVGDIVTLYEFNYKDEFYFDTSIYINTTNKKHLIKAAEVRYSDDKSSPNGYVHSDFGRSIAGVEIPIAYIGEYFSETTIDKNTVSGVWATSITFKGVVRVSECVGDDNIVHTDFKFKGFRYYNGNKCTFRSSVDTTLQFKANKNGDDGGLIIDEGCTLNQRKLNPDPNDTTETELRQIVYIHTPTNYCIIQGTLISKSLKITQ